MAFNTLIHKQSIPAASRRHLTPVTLEVMLTRSRNCSKCTTDWELKGQAEPCRNGSNRIRKPLLYPAELRDRSRAM